MKVVRRIVQNGEAYLNLEDMRQVLRGLQNGEEPQLLENSLGLMKVGQEIKATPGEIISRVIGNFIGEASGALESVRPRN
jgi:hypothetical protein